MGAQPDKVARMVLLTRVTSPAKWMPSSKPRHRFTLASALAAPAGEGLLATRAHGFRGPASAAPMCLLIVPICCHERPASATARISSGELALPHTATAIGAQVSAVASPAACARAGVGHRRKLCASGRSSVLVGWSSFGTTGPSHRSQRSVNDSLRVVASRPVPLISVSVYLPGGNGRSGRSRRLMPPRARCAVPRPYATP